MNETRTTPETKPETQYMVLAEREEGVWVECSTATGVNDKAAIKTAEAKPTDATTFVAIPMRSWRPRTRKVEQVTRETWA